MRLSSKLHDPAGARRKIGGEGDAGAGESVGGTGDLERGVVEQRLHDLFRHHGIAAAMTAALKIQRGHDGVAVAAPAQYAGKTFDDDRPLGAVDEHPPLRYRVGQSELEVHLDPVRVLHDHGVVVEAELGTLAGIEDDVKVASHAASYTRPEEVEEFVSKTGCDSLAIAIGTSHGAYKFTPAQCTRNEKGILVPPPLRFDVLDEIVKRLPGFPIVLHGSSSVPQNYVQMINANGGKMPDAVGIPEEQLRKAARSAVCKINIDSDLRLAMTGTIRAYFNEHPDHFDPRQYLKPARANIKELVRHKLIDVLGCAGKA